MSDKRPDERDIDEILASIDEMLGMKKEAPQATDERKDLVSSSASASEDILNVSSSAKDSEKTPSKLSSFEPFDENMPSQNEPMVNDEEQPRQRIVLTADDVEQSIQESLPLWAAQAEQDIKHDALSESDASETSNAYASNLDAMNQDQSPAIESIVEPADPTVEFVEPAPVEDGEGDASENEEETAETTSSSGPEPVEHFNESDETSGDEVDDESKEYKKFFEAIANDDTITFDINQDMDEDTVFEIEMLDKELVEAFVRDTLVDTDPDENKEGNIEQQAEHSEEINVESEEPSADDVAEADETNPIEVNDKFETNSFETNPSDGEKSYTLTDLQADNELSDFDDTFVHVGSSNQETQSFDLTDEDIEPTESSGNVAPESATPETDIEFDTNESIESNEPGISSHLSLLTEGESKLATIGETDEETEKEATSDDIEDKTENLVPLPTQNDEAEAFRKPVAEPAKDAKQVSDNNLITINPDELDPIIEMISDEVRIKVNQHLQQILPEIVSDILLEYLSMLRDNNEQ